MFTLIVNKKRKRGFSKEMASSFYDEDLSDFVLLILAEDHLLFCICFQRHTFGQKKL